jgi:hypothetical protein
MARVALSLIWERSEKDGGYIRAAVALANTSNLHR